ncbi:MAG: hypothetical protein MZU91_11335 [Desulfosudis oleivorans]|nr:hypothetical protein [Desulfosudis oleivorans]
MVVIPEKLHPRPARRQDDDADRGQEPGRAVPAGRRRGAGQHRGRDALGCRPGLRRRGQGHPGHARRPGRRHPLGSAWAWSSARPRKRCVAAEKYLNPLLLGLQDGGDEGGRRQDRRFSQKDLFSIILPGMADHVPAVHRPDAACGTSSPSARTASSGA